MKILDRLIAGQVVRDTLLVLLVLLSIFSLVDFLDDVSDVGKGRYTMVDAIEYMALTTPRRAFVLFPLAAVIGALLGLGTLARNMELAVMRASGVSVARIAAAALKGALVLTLAGFLLGELATPKAERIAQQLRSEALSDRVALHTKHGFWVRDGNSFINVRELLPDSRMGDLYIYEFAPTLELRSATHAERGSYREGYWVLENVRTSIIGENTVTTKTLARTTWHSQFSPDLAEIVSVRLESLSALGLARYIDYLRANELATAPYEVALWGKVMYPLATLVMIMLALALTLGRLGTTGSGQRIVAGVMIAIAFHMLQQAAGRIGVVYGASPMLSVAMPSLVFLALSLWLLRRAG
ncbi:MAG: LPS export ABC transporter permease LptG [Gammaproteobacteria bacterium]|nr:LPS export ABC transporter permease LptG [Gammaproteobacteria bacterium]